LRSILRAAHRRISSDLVEIEHGARKVTWAPTLVVEVVNSSVAKLDQIKNVVMNVKLVG
jgi:hypothetical protein